LQHYLQIDILADDDASLRTWFDPFSQRENDQHQLMIVNFGGICVVLCCVVLCCGVSRSGYCESRLRHLVIGLEKEQDVQQVHPWPESYFHTDKVASPSPICLCFFYFYFYFIYLL
jgi:hypothetical protein